MSLFLFLLLVSFRFQYISEASKGIDDELNSSACDGEGTWSAVTFQNTYHTAASRITSAEVSSGVDWFEASCPTQSFVYSCYYHNKKAKSVLSSLDHRRWDTPNAACLRFYPYDFIQSLSGRRLVLYGDSVMGQIWQSLVCSLNQVTNSTLRYGEHIYAGRFTKRIALILLFDRS